MGGDSHFIEASPIITTLSTSYRRDSKSDRFLITFHILLAEREYKMHETYMYAASVIWKINKDIDYPE